MLSAIEKSAVLTRPDSGVIVQYEDRGSHLRYRCGLTCVGGPFFYVDQRPAETRVNRPKSGPDPHISYDLMPEDFDYYPQYPTRSVNCSEWIPGTGPGQNSIWSNFNRPLTSFAMHLTSIGLSIRKSKCVYTCWSRTHDVVWSHYIWQYVLRDRKDV